MIQFNQRSLASSQAEINHPPRPSDSNPSQQSIILPPKDRATAMPSQSKAPTDSSIEIESEVSYDFEAREQKYINFKVGKTVRIIRQNMRKMIEQENIVDKVTYVAEILNILEENKRHILKSNSFRRLYGFLLEIYKFGYWEELTVGQLKAIRIQFGRFASGSLSYGESEKAIQKLITKGINPLPRSREE